MSDRVSNLPKFTEFFNPAIEVLKDMGGSGYRQDILSAVVEKLGLTEEEVSQSYDKRPDVSIVLDRIGWALSHLKRGGILESGGRSVWVLKDKNQGEVDAEEMVRATTREYFEKRGKQSGQEDGSAEIEEEFIEESQKEYRDALLDIIKNISPKQFEILCRELLRELGFVDVEVIGGAGDKGIDGNCILVLNDLISFRVAFQCKRYEGVVGPSAIRDFRGSMTANVDRGLVITTGQFTPKAYEEAIDSEKDKIIDLIDGDRLIEKIKEVELGVHTRDVKEIESIDREYFENL